MNVQQQVVKMVTTELEKHVGKKITPELMEEIYETLHEQVANADLEGEEE